MVKETSLTSFSCPPSTMTLALTPKQDNPSWVQDVNQLIIAADCPTYEDLLAFWQASNGSAKPLPGARGQQQDHHQHQFVSPSVGGTG